LSGRDYTYVEDVIAGVLASIEYVPASGPRGSLFEIFNLGNSRPVRLGELVELLEKATGRRAVRQQLPEQPGDVPITWADISKAKRLLGYDPQTPIEKGLEQFVSWYRRARADHHLKTA
jgi:UDP-glucuronate 4-epimerase